MAQIFQKSYRLVDQLTRDTGMSSTHLLILLPVQISSLFISIHNLTTEQYMWTIIILLMSMYPSYRYSLHPI